MRNFRKNKEKIALEKGDHLLAESLNREPINIDGFFTKKNLKRD
ncbi:hypothetical protein ACQ9ZF_11465 (plasmid) [Cetobacterium somerae]